MRSKLEECQGTRVVLVRHGQSTYNKLGLYQGSSDESVLTETGYTDARQTGAFLKGLAFDAIYSSSLKRAQATAKEILGVMAPEVDPNIINVTSQLRETDMPAWEGLAFQYVRETFPEDYRNWKQRPHEFCMDSKKNLTSQLHIYPAIDLYKRGQQFWQEVLPRHIGQTLLLVTHGGTNRALISTALGITPDRYHCIQQSNCGISVLHFPDGSLESGRLEAMNLTAHMGEHLSIQGGSGLRLFLVPSETTHPEQTQQLAQLLQETKINFSITEDINNSQATAKQILQYHPEAVQLAVLRQDFPEAWQQGINARNTAFTFLTGLVVGGESVIKRLLGQAIGMNLDHLQRLQVHPGTISCIHYPGSEHPPVLQAMNVSGAEKDLILGYPSISRVYKTARVIENTAILFD